MLVLGAFAALPISVPGILLLLTKSSVYPNGQTYDWCREK
ncbi:hypothetical protein PtrM4_068690 [Pyrenophora tritici-repentis]|uniref:Uncharacterized protein n=1 Tax=Pyrenophora tritici-repentis TaxID=45151 RepID=A0A834VTB2_9PLEO|nr:hypothetical protein PtrM4_068690 [Pyrenophora tritici-repentis]